MARSIQKLDIDIGCRQQIREEVSRWWTDRSRLGRLPITIQIPAIWILGEVGARRPLHPNRRPFGASVVFCDPLEGRIAEFCDESVETSGRSAKRALDLHEA